jgi:hypothetical protein
MAISGMKNRAICWYRQSRGLEFLVRSFSLSIEVPPIRVVLRRTFIGRDLFREQLRRFGSAMQ